MRIITLLLVFCWIGFAQAKELDCNHGNGSYDIDFDYPEMRSAVFTIVDASGVENAKGTLVCNGPIQSAYVCEGKINALDPSSLTFTGPNQIESIVVPEVTVQVGQGPIKINGPVYGCHLKIK